MAANFKGGKPVSERFLFFLALLTACSAQTYSENAPSWVNSLRGGNSTLRLTNGDKVLFRSNYKGGKNPDREAVCDAAVRKNEEFIRKSYPRSAVIPMTVELRYFDPVVRDCSTTISVPRSFTDGADESVKKAVGVQGADTGVLNLTTAPDASADVFVDDVLVSQSDSNVKIAVKAGRHVLRVDHPNYQAFERKITVSPHSELPVSVSLTPARVTVRVDVGNGVAAQVYLNGEPEGKTPASFPIEINRDNVLLLKHPEFLEYAVPLNARDMRRGDDVDLSGVALTEKPAYLSFTSDPAGAEILVDGANAGKTPVKRFQVSRGTHKFETFKDGYFAKSGEVSAVGGKTVAKHLRLDRNIDARFVVSDTPVSAAETAVAAKPSAAVEVVARDGYHAFDFTELPSASPVLPRAATREGILEALMRWDYPDNFLRAAVSYNEKGEFYLRVFFDKQAYETAFFDKINGILNRIPKDSAACKIEKTREWTGKYDSNKYKIYQNVVTENCDRGVTVAKSDGKTKKYKIAYLKDLAKSSAAKKTAARRAVTLRVGYADGSVKVLTVPFETEKFSIGGGGLSFAPALRRKGTAKCLSAKEQADLDGRRADLNRRLNDLRRRLKTVGDEIDGRWFAPRELKDERESLKKQIAAVEKQVGSLPKCSVDVLLNQDDFLLARRKLPAKGVVSMAVSFEKGGEQ